MKTKEKAQHNFLDDIVSKSRGKKKNITASHASPATKKTTRNKTKKTMGKTKSLGVDVEDSNNTIKHQKKINGLLAERKKIKESKTTKEPSDERQKIKELEKNLSDLQSKLDHVSKELKTTIERENQTKLDSKSCREENRRLKEKLDILMTKQNIEKSPRNETSFQAPLHVKIEKQNSGAATPQSPRIVSKHHPETNHHIIETHRDDMKLLNCEALAASIKKARSEKYVKLKKARKMEHSISSSFLRLQTDAKFTH